MYQAHAGAPDRPVVLRVYDHPGVSREETLVSLRVLSRVDHQHLLPLCGVGSHAGYAFGAFPLLEEPTLSEVLRLEGPLEVNRAVAVCNDIAGVLAAFEAQGVVYRDLSSSTVSLARRGERGDYHIWLPPPDIVVRTGEPTAEGGSWPAIFDYLTPEELSGEGVDARTDVYALGTLFFECVTGQPPFPYSGVTAQFLAHLREPPPKPTQERPELPTAVDHIVVRAMAKEPADRFSGPGQFASELRALRGERGSSG